MKIKRITIENYRLLKYCSLDLEDELSLLIGKNNTGKTSVLLALDQFLNASERTKFTYDDFNIDCKKTLEEAIKKNGKIPEVEYKPFAISMRLLIRYNGDDDLSVLRCVMMDLDPNNNFVVLDFSYSLDYINFERIKKEYTAFKQKEEEKKGEKEGYKTMNISDFLKQTQGYYFNRSIKSIAFDFKKEEANELDFIDLTKQAGSIKEIINFKFIAAKRAVSNAAKDQTLSSQTSDIYKRQEANQVQTNAINDFKQRLHETDQHLNEIYKGLFEETLKNVSTFGGVKPKESAIEIISTLQHRELLAGNTTVMYKHDGNDLPEQYNGLGYMNLISMIFEIEILLQAFKRDKLTAPAAINLLFIEEPEAHTHPQMQCIFIKNIKALLKKGVVKDGNKHELQYIISTHSAHIVANSDFEDIKYLQKESGKYSVVANSLKVLIDSYDKNTNQYQFLKQYLTISKAEIFFADKVILIEGDTERILLPTMMRKMDLEAENKNEIDLLQPLLSQNISIIEVGAYAQIFEKFIHFLGIKTLLITDLDATQSKDPKAKKCEVSDGKGFSNTAIKYFFPAGTTLAQLQRYELSDKLFYKIDNQWIQTNGTTEPAQLCIVFQTFEKGYHASSFEDAFIRINREWITTNKDNFTGLQNRGLFDSTTDAYVLANKCINKKTHFALDIVFHGNDRFTNWHIPDYIKEGLSWLKEEG